MACILDSGYTIGCLDNFGGVQKVFIANFSDIASFTLDGTGMITTITDTTGSAPVFYTFEQNLEVASFSENATNSVENGTSFFEPTLSITLQKLTQAQKNQIKTLVQGAWRIMVLDQLGAYHLLGFGNPMRVSASTAGVGKAAGDLNGAVITFIGKERELAPTVDPDTAIGAIIP